jgi:hypothetical protein
MIIQKSAMAASASSKTMILFFLICGRILTPYNLAVCISIENF